MIKKKKLISITTILVFMLQILYYLPVTAAPASDPWINDYVINGVTTHVSSYPEIITTNTKNITISGTVGNDFDKWGNGTAEIIVYQGDDKTKNILSVGSTSIAAKSDKSYTYNLTLPDKDDTYKVVIKVIHNGNLKIVYSNELWITKVTPELDVLEVQPGRTFELNSKSFGGKIKSLTQMSMPEFISNIEEINGKYDVVYVGNKIDVQNINGSNVNVGYSLLGSAPTNIPQGGTNGRSPSEYYPGNDITEKRANDLKEYIQSGQLVIFDNGIFNDSSLSLTKLNQIFDRTYRNSYSNFKLVNRDSIGSFDISVYNSCNKRPKLTINDVINDKPTEYNGDYSSYSSNRSMSYKFDLTNLNEMIGSDNLMTVKLYIDFNGDGIFKDSEVVQTITGKKNGTGYNISYRIPDTFTGLLPWKLEATDTNTNAKSWTKGNTAYSGQQLSTRVLQLVPSNGTSLSIKNMGTSTAPLVTKEYNIKVTQLRLDIFNKNYPKDVEILDDGSQWDGWSYAHHTTVKTALNGNYDMIILGFSDSYGGLSNGGSDITSNNAIQGIKDFIKTGQSVMFTHDTQTFYVNNNPSWAYNLTKQFRDIIGQSRYFDLNNPTGKNIDGTNIKHDSYPNGATSYGFSISALDRANNGGKFNTTTQTYQINKGSITQYPYVLPSNLPVASTHYQYFQLNLEDPDVIPWYTLKGTRTNDMYDGRNFYYTYSKGNITYSGTGHSAPNGEPEHKFFINTMIKAAKGANHAPTLEVVNVADGDNISKSQDSMDFSFIATDIDNDPMTGEIYINDKLVSGLVINGKTISGGTISGDDIKSGVPVTVSIPKELLKSIIGDNTEFTLKVKATDDKDAENSSSFKLNYVSDPSLVLSSDVANGYLIGDRATINLTATASKSDANISTLMKNINLAIEPSDSNAITLNSSSNTKLNDVTFSPNPDPNTQNKQFNFTFNKEGNYKIDNSFSYQFSNIKGGVTQYGDYKYPISIKSGKIDVKVLDVNGKVMNPTDITFKREGGTPIVISTGSTGISTLISNDDYTVPSGRYTVSMNVPSGFSAVINGTNQTIDGNTISAVVDLSYDNSQGNVEFRFNGLAPVGTITYDKTTTKPVQGPIIAYLTVDRDVYLKASDGMYTIPLKKGVQYPYQFDENGSHTFEFKDMEYGNPGQAVATVNNIDNIPPSAPSLSQAPDKDTPTSGNVAITAYNWPSDAAVKEYRYEKNDNTIDKDGFTEVSWTAYTGAFEVTDNCTVYARAKDEAGNISEQTIISVNNIDRTPPVGTVTYTTNSDGTITATLTVSDNLSKSDKIKITSEGGAQHVFTKTDKFTFTFEDEAGNAGTADSDATVSGHDPGDGPSDPDKPIEGKQVER